REFREALPAPSASARPHAPERATSRSLEEIAQPPPTPPFRESEGSLPHGARCRSSNARSPDRRRSRFRRPADKEARRPINPWEDKEIRASRERTSCALPPSKNRSAVRPHDERQAEHEPKVARRQQE